FLYPGSKGTPNPQPTAPAAPSALGALATSSSTISLTWADNSNNETGFQLERKPGVSGIYVLVASPGANQTSYTDSGLQSSTTYYYRIRAINSVGSSAYSNEANATTQAVTPPSATNNAAFVSQSVPTSLMTGQSVTISITMRNTGTTTWLPTSHYLMTQNPTANSIWGRSAVGLWDPVAP